MARPPLPLDCVLVRTAEGTRKMRSHAADITPKLRSVLFLVDGVQSVQKILDRAGELRALLESQLRELMRLGLVDAVGCAAEGSALEAKPNRLPLPNVCVGDIAPSGIPPIIGAKMHLLRALDIFDDYALTQYSTSLVEARSWHDLAARAKDISHSAREVAGSEAALVFWERAKEILVTWRGKDVSLDRQ